jgi:ubiquinone/menaquinone biosynthesis C-methylase UbiE
MNPMMLTFLEYDRAARFLGFREGDNVLVLGAGAVPHHVRWKRRLGNTGGITALEIEPLVLRDSLRWERLIEWIRSLFCRRRWISEHIEGDATEMVDIKRDKFDYVVAIRCYAVSVGEAMRVLKPGGKLLMVSCGDISGLPRDDRLESSLLGLVVTNADTTNEVLSVA